MSQPTGSPLATLVEFLTQDVTRSDVIALGSLLAACLAAIYARRQSDEAKRSRLSAVRESRRPLRLEIYRVTLQFCTFCCQYYTRYLMKDTNGTRELVAEIDSFKWEVEQHGPLEMPNVEAETKALLAMAWNLQRSLDRLPRPGSSTESTAVSQRNEDDLHDLIDMFAVKRKELRDLFAPYLTEA